MDTTVQDPLVGQTLDGRYRVEARIAVGGMATVYRALDTRLDRVLALKVMHPGLAADGGFVERFIREAKAVARLSHPNVVGVFDQGTDGTYVYLAMEYVAGCTLRDVLRERGALTPRAALDVLEPVLAALGAAHRAGLVHRDAKPENVLIGDAGRVKVADFGLVRGVDAQTSSSGALLGTVSYLAPEQIGHGQVDERTDVYACGVMLYEMLTGAKPYEGDTAMEVIVRRLNEDVPPPSAALPGLAPQLDALVARATSRDPEGRPADAVALLAEVRAVRAELTDEELDHRAAPVQTAGSVPVGAEDPTSVVHPLAALAMPAPPAPSGQGDDELHRTTRLLPRRPADGEPYSIDDTPTAPPPVPSRPGGNGGRQGRAVRGPAWRGRRGVLAVLAALLVVLGVAGGVWYVNDGQFTHVPGVLALPQAEAQHKLSAAGLDTEVRKDYSLTVPRGSVISTDPAPGKRIRGNGTVTLTVSEGPRQVKVPDVSGHPLADAQQQLKDAGLVPGTVGRSFNDSVPQGSVIVTDPPAGREIAPGTPIAFTISRGSPVDVPDVIGKSVTEAQQTLQDAGFQVVLSPDKAFSDEADKDTVALETPDRDTQAAKGDTVTITVSKGQQLFPVPDVTGQNQDDAEATLKAAGFEVRVISLFFGDTVFNESPDGGSQAPKGATVTLWVR
ncbi:Stk1 family PASTA domain-containing Ser/Thr kinase [Streptomyces sp. NPDC021020]|uniref:Stk1 family PASTA domain-containing Ser/Thr kinase n=1 Tax=Streptomyces sp. NPDC021020 TaxID=3365109 RepID=UPI0037B33295